MNDEQLADKWMNYCDKHNIKIDGVLGFCPKATTFGRDYKALQLAAENNDPRALTLMFKFKAGL